MQYLRIYGESLNDESETVIFDSLPFPDNHITFSVWLLLRLLVGSKVRRPSKGRAAVLNVAYSRERWAKLTDLTVDNLDKYLAILQRFGKITVTMESVGELQLLRIEIPTLLFYADESMQKALRASKDSGGQNSGTVPELREAKAKAQAKGEELKAKAKRGRGSASRTGPRASAGGDGARPASAATAEREKAPMPTAEELRAARQAKRAEILAQIDRSKIPARWGDVPDVDVNQPNSSENVPLLALMLNIEEVFAQGRRYPIPHAKERLALDLRRFGYYIDSHGVQRDAATPDTSTAGDENFVFCELPANHHGAHRAALDDDEAPITWETARGHFPGECTGACPAHDNDTDFTDGCTHVMTHSIHWTTTRNI